MDKTKKQIGSAYVVEDNGIISVAAENIHHPNFDFSIVDTNYEDLKNLGVDERKIEELKEIVHNSKADKVVLTTKALSWVGEVGKVITQKGLSHSLPKIYHCIGELIHRA
jgi:recombinational DNA repair protein RecR